MGTPLGAKGPGLDFHVWGGVFCIPVISLEPGYIEFFDGDGAICFEPQRGGLR